jgi:hypothetical protein
MSSKVKWFFLSLVHCIAERLPTFWSLSIASALFEPEADQTARIDDEADGSVTQDTAPGETFHLADVLGQGFDDDLLVAHDLVDQEARPTAGALDTRTMPSIGSRQAPGTLKISRASTGASPSRAG